MGKKRQAYSQILTPIAQKVHGLSLFSRQYCHCRRHARWSHNKQYVTYQAILKHDPNSLLIKISWPISLVPQGHKLQVIQHLCHWSKNLILCFCCCCVCHVQVRVADRKGRGGEKQRWTEKKNTRGKRGEEKKNTKTKCHIL